MWDDITEEVEQTVDNSFFSRETERKVGFVLSLICHAVFHCFFSFFLFPGDSQYFVQLALLLPTDVSVTKRGSKRIFASACVAISTHVCKFHGGQYIHLLPLSSSARLCYKTRHRNGIVCKESLS